jgi:hypothetical protein
LRAVAFYLEDGIAREVYFLELFQAKERVESLDGLDLVIGGNELRQISKFSKFK